jgi:hypothetical protein
MGENFLNLRVGCSHQMPATIPEYDAAYMYPELYRSPFPPGIWERNLKNLGILVGLFGIAILPLAMPLGLALIVSGMEFIWLASPDLL